MQWSDLLLKCDLHRQSRYYKIECPSLDFLFLRKLSITFRKFSSRVQITPICFGTSLQRGHVLSIRAFFYGFSVSMRLPCRRYGLHRDFSVSGGGSMTRHGAEVFLWPCSHDTQMAVYLLLPGLNGSWPQSVHTRTDWPRGQWTVDIGSISTEQLFEQLKATLQLSRSVASAWSDGATLHCAIAYNILLHQLDQALRGVSPLVSLEELEHLCTAPFGALSLFDELETKLQLWDKVASRQWDYALYRGSAPFTVGKIRAAPHRSAPARSAQWRQDAVPMLLSFSGQQPFLVIWWRGSGRPFCQRGGWWPRSWLPVS